MPGEIPASHRNFDTRHRHREFSIPFLQLSLLRIVFFPLTYDLALLLKTGNPILINGTIAFPFQLARVIHPLDGSSITVMHICICSPKTDSPKAA